MKLTTIISQTGIRIYEGNREENATLRLLDNRAGAGMQYWLTA